jgi:hypothetical protein
MYVMFSRASRLGLGLFLAFGALFATIDRNLQKMLFMPLPFTLFFACFSNG